jgi:hypothetical protein
MSGITAHGQVFTMQLIADNDFAVFAGTESGITRLIYQNDVGWPSQLAVLSTLNFTLQSGETTFYLLGMGGGGVEENISGTMNGVDITQLDDPVEMSSDISLFLADYQNQNQGTGTLETGEYDASLSDVQAAFSSVTWAAPTVNNTQTVITQSPTGQGYSFSTGTARLFKVAVTSVIPEPSTVILTGLGVVALLALRRRTSA